MKKWMRKCFANELRVHAASLLINASFSLCHDFGFALTLPSAHVSFANNGNIRTYMENRSFI